MQRFGRLKVTDLNPHLSCILCGGYFIDATTITECLHSFCRACIVRYLETSKYCPVCEVQVHKSRPLHYIRSDKTLQDIVYKLVPGLFHNEMKIRRELYASKPPEAIKESRDAEDRGECLDEKFIFSPEEIFSLSLEFDHCKGEDDQQEEPDDNDPRRRFLRCPAAITVAHLKKFIRMKYGIPNTYQIALRFDKEFMLDEYTLVDVAYVSLWKRNGPIRLFYRIMEKPPKRLKIRPIAETKSEADAKSLKIESKTDDTETQNNKKDLEISLKSDALTAKIPDPVTENTPEPPKRKEKHSSKTSDVIPAKKQKIPSETMDWKPAVKDDFKAVPEKVASATAVKDSKPAVMTVSPLPKPEMTAMTTGGVTVGHYTGISIKKSPPNTLPPFRISSHLLPPRVPPLKLSPPRFSRLEACVRQMSGHQDGLSSPSKKLKTSSTSRDPVEPLVPLVIPIPPMKIKDPSRRKSDDVSGSHRKSKSSKTLERSMSEVQRPKLDSPKETVTVKPSPSRSEMKSSCDDDDKMDLDSELFGGPLVIAEPEVSSKEDEASQDCLPGNTSKAITPIDKDDKLSDEDEEIDVVDDGEVDSGRGSDISSRAEARSLCGDDDLDSPGSAKTPEDPLKSPVTPAPEAAKKTLPNGIKCNGNSPANGSHHSKDDFGVLDLSTCGRKRIFPKETFPSSVPSSAVPLPRSMQVANPAVLDKSRQTACPKGNPFKLLPSVLPIPCKKPDTGSRNNFRCRGSGLTVFNPDPNSCSPKIVIKNLNPRPGHDGGRHHHHHHHNHHHQRM